MCNYPPSFQRLLRIFDLGVIRKLLRSEFPKRGELPLALSMHALKRDLFSPFARSRKRDHFVARVNSCLGISRHCRLYQGVSVCSIRFYEITFTALYEKQRIKINTEAKTVQNLFIYNCTNRLISRLIVTLCVHVTVSITWNDWKIFSNFASTLFIITFLLFWCPNRFYKARDLRFSFQSSFCSTRIIRYA